MAWYCHVRSPWQRDPCVLHLAHQNRDAQCKINVSPRHKASLVLWLYKHNSRIVLHNNTNNNNNHYDDYNNNNNNNNKIIIIIESKLVGRRTEGAGHP